MSEAAAVNRQGRGPYWLLGFFGPLVVAPVWVVLARSLGWPRPLDTFAGAVVALLLLTSAGTDLARRKIYNWATYPAFLYGVGINLVGAVLEPPEIAWLGTVGLWNSVLTALGCFLLVGLLASSSGGGAGDVKLATALGALLGGEYAGTALLLSYAVAALAVVAYLVVRYGFWVVADLFLRRLVGYFVPGWLDPPGPTQQEMLRLRFPLAPFFAAGTLVALTLMRPL